MTKLCASVSFRLQSVGVLITLSLALGGSGLSEFIFCTYFVNKEKMENFWHMIFRHFNIYNDIYATSIQSSCLSVYIFVCI